MTIIYWTVSWLIGIWLAARWPVAWLFWFILCAVGVIGVVLFRRKKLEKLAAVCLTILCLGALRYHLADRPLPDNHISNFNGTEEVIVTGVVIEEPDVRENSTQLVVEAESYALENGIEKPVQGKVIIYVQRYPPIAYGTQIQAKGQLKTPINRTSFDYEQYLAYQKIYSEMSRPDTEVLASGLGNPLMSSLLAVKVRAKETINRLIPEPEAALLNGILLGYDHGLPRDLAEDFRTTGITHIIAISGFNIAIIAGILLRSGRYFLSPRLAGIIAIVGISLYTILVGAETAVVRAAVMGSLFIVALIFLGRPTYLYASLFAAALFITIVNPLLMWDVGSQLSFMAVLGLMSYVGPWSHRLSGKLEPRIGESLTQNVTRMIADVFLTTLAAIIMTLPIMLYYFDTFSLVSPIANILILPAQPGVMVVGGLATILGMISPLLGQIPAWAAWLLLAYTNNLVRFFADVPFSSINVSISTAFVVFYYGFIFAMTWISGLEEEKQEAIFGRSRRSRILRAGVIAAIFIAVLAGIWAWKQPDGKLHVTFFDVGQGDAIFIETPDGRQVVVDGGRYPSLFLDKLGHEMPFWDRDLDIVVATHGDEDHILGLVDALERYKVGLLLVNGAEADGSEGYEALLETADKAQVPVKKALAGEVIELGDGTRLEILHPGSELDADDRNENSVSLRLVYGDFAVLLTGDADDEAERMMMGSGRPLNSTVFKAGHHGSRSSSSRAFLQAVQPQIIVISAGKENRYDHPHQEMLQRAEEIGAAVLRTDEMGTIELISEGEELWWQTER